jgi:uncharacterized protein YndB with AHSA1/START domain
MEARRVAAEAGTAEREIVTSRLYDAPRALVFDAWTKPEHLQHWWGPNGFTNTIHVMDVRPGGKWTHVMHGPDGTDYKNDSVFEEVAPPKRLSYRHLTGPNFHATVDFAEEGGKTRVTLRMVFATKAERDNTVERFGAVEGAKQTFERLAQYLPRMEEMLTVSRTYDAPRALVFSAWSSGERLARWWGPNGFTAPVCNVDFRPGGKLEICMKGFGMEHWMRGRFDEIVDQERIVFTVDVEGADAPIHTVVTFAESAGKTTMTVRQSVPKHEMMARGQRQGWTEQLERLAHELR